MRRTRKLPVIKETPAELQALMSTEEDKKMRTRLHCLLLVSLGEARSKTHLAALLGVDRDTVRPWLAAYAAGGIGALRPGRPGSPERSALATQGPLPGSLVAEVGRRLADPEGCPQGWKQLWQDLKRDFGLDMAYPAFYKAARRRFPGARCKAARPRHVKKLAGADEGFKKN